ncbi:MAG: S-methyl-5-thioribose-1-phosphate isomerase [Planctomycetota bacterium]|jgi:methylthioribose-1-phosphate isomerase
MPITTIEWSGDPSRPREGHVRLIDQTRLPVELVHIDCEDTETLWEAIKILRVRGAPALGVAGAMGVVLGLRETKSASGEELVKEADEVAAYFATSRPTAVNLFWALDRMKAKARELAAKPDADVEEMLRVLLAEALEVLNEDRETCRAMGRHGAELLPDEATILTHCNAGALATADYGTALGVIYAAVEAGKKVSAYCDETRPLLQGARLSAWELTQAGVPTTVICDNMAAVVLRQGKIDAVIVGSDRIAANGDVANKIGTYGLSVLAKEHGVPFYVVAPVSTFDLTLDSGEKIPIEERPPGEVSMPFGMRTAPKEAAVYNPAFDVTPAANVTAIVTEKGVLRPPLAEAIKRELG